MQASFPLHRNLHCYFFILTRGLPQTIRPRKFQQCHRQPTIPSSHRIPPHLLLPVNAAALHFVRLRKTTDHLPSRLGLPHWRRNPFLLLVFAPENAAARDAA
ncbi:hypothetical protein TRVL_08252 [Trypanosoma vivax]|nr:hypothetical protein TRVL_08252 [Trypanosoma vivax]